MDPINIPQQTFSGTVGGGELSLYNYFTASPLFAGFVDFEGPDRKVFLDQYVNMSPSLRNFLASAETAANLSALGLSYQLEDSQVSKLASTLRELVMGKVFIKDLPITVSSRLGIDDIKAGEITNKIISQSFGPIIEDIKRIQRTKFSDKITQLQKELRPEGLTQQNAKPEMPKPSTPPPLNRPPSQPEKPQMPPPPLQSKPLQPISQPIQQPRPPLQAPQTLRPPLQMPPKLEVKQPEPVKPEPPQLENQNKTQEQKPPLNKPEFKMPNLGPIDLTKDMESFSAPQDKKPGADDNKIVNKDSQKALEEELEKVANVIDLRAKSEE